MSITIRKSDSRLQSKPRPIIINEASEKPNKSNTLFICRLMGDRKGPYSPLTSRAGSLSRTKSGWYTPTSKSMYFTSTSPYYTRRTSGRSMSPFQADPSRCILSFPDSTTTVAAIEEPLTGAALANITSVSELERFWYFLIKY